MDPTPIGLSLAGGRLVVEWSDGQRRTYGIAELRQACPCAGCLSQRSAPGTEPPQPPPGDLEIRQMQPAGNYAYRIDFSDGHSTGIYPLDLLRRLGTRED